MGIVNYTNLNILSGYGKFGIEKFGKMSRRKVRGNLIFGLRIMLQRIIRDSDDQEYSCGYELIPGVETIA